MTRQETISAAQSFTEKHKDSHKIHLENGYIEASVNDLIKKNLLWDSPEIDRINYARISADNHEEVFGKSRIWAINENGVFTTEF